MADFIAQPGDGNSFNALIGSYLALENNRYISAFAHANDDNGNCTRRLKNSIEGGVMQTAVDATGLFFMATGQACPCS